mgnify:CR=1 FL=1
MVYGVKDALIVEFVKKPPGKAPNGEMVDTPFYEVKYDFVLEQEAGGGVATSEAGREPGRSAAWNDALQTRDPGLSKQKKQPGSTHAGAPLTRCTRVRETKKDIDAAYTPPFRADHVGSLLRPAALRGCPLAVRAARSTPPR